jgi:hypothetical protein
LVPRAANDSKEPKVSNAARWMNGRFALASRPSSYV